MKDPGASWKCMKESTLMTNHIAALIVTKNNLYPWKTLVPAGNAWKNPHWWLTNIVALIVTKNNLHPKGPGSSWKRTGTGSLASTNRRLRYWINNLENSTLSRKTDDFSDYPRELWHPRGHWDTIAEKPERSLSKSSTTSQMEKKQSSCDIPAEHFAWTHSIKCELNRKESDSFSDFYELRRLKFPTHQ